MVIAIHTVAIKYYANQHCYRGVENIESREVGLVFGAGYLRSGKPSKYLRDRLNSSVELFNNGKISKILVSGDNGRTNHNEPKVMKNYLVNKGIPKSKIFVDCAGFDTYSSVWRAKNVFRVKSAIMLSQNFHLDRAVYISKMLGIDALGFSANKGSYSSYRKYSFLEVPKLIKSSLDLVRGRKPKYSKDSIDINGSSNFEDCN